MPTRAEMVDRLAKTLVAAKHAHEDLDRVDNDVLTFINGGDVPEYAHGDHPFWDLLGERWLPAVKHALGNLYNEWGVKEGWYGAIGNMNLTAKGTRHLPAEEARQMLEAEGFEMARRQPSNPGAVMLVKKGNPVRGGAALPVYVKVRNMSPGCDVSISIGVEAGYPD
jgi:hypothetical protein